MSGRKISKRNIRTGYFHLIMVNSKNGQTESNYYKINYKDTYELMQKVVFILLAPELLEHKEITVQVGKEFSLIYYGEFVGQNIKVRRADGRIIKSLIKYSTTAEEIDRQFYAWEGRSKLAIKFIFSVGYSDYVHLSGVY